MKVLALCPDELPDNANTLVNYYPTSPEFAGKFVNSFCKALIIEEAHTIAFGRDFGKDETNCFIFNRINEHRRTIFKNNGADWVICLNDLVTIGPTGNCITIITHPMHLNADDIERFSRSMTTSLPGDWSASNFSEFASRYEDEISFYREENLKLKDKISRLNRELDVKELLSTNGCEDT